jgi:hypothetical protein
VSAAPASDFFDRVLATGHTAAKARSIVPNSEWFRKQTHPIRLGSPSRHVLLRSLRATASGTAYLSSLPRVMTPTRGSGRAGEVLPGT